jgi:hypothetical protein
MMATAWTNAKERVREKVEEVKKEGQGERWCGAGECCRL